MNEVKMPVKMVSLNMAFTLEKAIVFIMGRCECD